MKDYERENFYTIDCNKVFHLFFIINPFRFFFNSVRVTDTMSFLVILSIILMIIANELTFIHIDDIETRTSWFIKLFISISTMILLILIIYYHYLDLKLFSNHNTLKHSRVGLTNIKICLIILELIICAIHPMPRSYPDLMSSKLTEDISESHPFSYIGIDVALSLPSMFEYLLKI